MNDANRSALVRVRGARETDLDRLPDIDVSAARRFAGSSQAWIVDMPPMPLDKHQAFHAAGHLWVAVDADDLPVGFLAAEPLDDALHIAELSVCLDVQGRGLGSAMLDVALAAASASGFRCVTLTTYRDLSWNAPFYARHGFVIVAPAVLGPAHVAKTAEEASAGHDVSSRCCMVRMF